MATTCILAVSKLNAPATKPIELINTAGNGPTSKQSFQTTLFTSQTLADALSRKHSANSKPTTIIKTTGGAAHTPYINSRYPMVMNHGEDYRLFPDDETVRLRITATRGIPR